MTSQPAPAPDLSPPLPQALGPTQEGNGSNTSLHPVPPRKARRGLSPPIKALLVVAVLLVGTGGVALGGAVLGFWSVLGLGSSRRPDLLLHKVQYERLQLTIVERGTLE